LFNGKDYVEDADRGSNLDASDLAVHHFKKSKIVMSLDAFDLHKTEESQFAHYEIMRNNIQLQADEDSLIHVMRIMKKDSLARLALISCIFISPSTNPSK